MLTLKWTKCAGDAWCEFLKVNLDGSRFTDLAGVYAIWQYNPQIQTVKVGQGMIRQRLAQHREEQEILAFANHTLFVSWAQVPPGAVRDGIERYLTEQLKPKVSEPLRTGAEPVTVNLMWDLVA